MFLAGGQDKGSIMSECRYSPVFLHHGVVNDHRDSCEGETNLGSNR